MSAFNFESIMKHMAVQAVLKLTTTPDQTEWATGLDCHAMRADSVPDASRSTAANGELTLVVLARNTRFTRAADLTESIHDVFRALGRMMPGCGS